MWVRVNFARHNVHILRTGGETEAAEEDGVLIRQKMRPCSRPEGRRDRFAVT